MKIDENRIVLKFVEFEQILYEFITVSIYIVNKFNIIKNILNFLLVRQYQHYNNILIEELNNKAIKITY